MVVSKLFCEISPFTYKISAYDWSWRREAYFKEEADGIYRYNKIYRRQFDKTTGNLLKEELIIENRAKVMYDKSYVENRKEYIGL